MQAVFAFLRVARDRTPREDCVKSVAAYIGRRAPSGVLVSVLPGDVLDGVGWALDEG